jgi:hypothetical protein
MKWIINNLMVMNQEFLDMVTMSNFTISDIQGDLQGSVTYSVNLLPADPDNYTPYSQVTMEQAIDWTKAALGESRVTAMEKEVQDMIDIQKIAVPVSAPLPWVLVEPTPQE